jgi:hypothetical protein
MKLRFINTQTLFHTAGLLSTVASVSGVFSYLMLENNADTLLSIGGFMSVGGAVGLGLSIYFGWEVAFNHKGIAKRVAAGLIASSAALLSGYTLYQNAAHPILEQAHTAQVEQETRTLQQQSAATAVLQQQQADLRTQMEDLRQQNKADTASIATLEADTKAGEARQDKNATRQIAQLRKAIEVRTTEIGKLSERVENYTKRLTATPEPKASNEGQGNVPVQPEQAVLSWAMLARASMYEVMTALFLLFGSWFRADRREQDHAQATQLQTVTVAAQTALHDLQTATHTLGGVVAQANTLAAALDESRTNTRTLLTEIAEQLAHIHTKATEGVAIIQQQDRTSERLQAETTTMQALLVRATETTAQLQQGVAPATTLLQDLQNTVVTCNGAIAHAKEAIAPAIETAMACNRPAIATAMDGSQQLNMDAAKKLLKTRSINPAEDGAVTLEVIMQATGWGRTKATELRESACKCGYLSRESRGKGFTYSYNNGADKAQQLDFTNVVQLPARNA